MTDAATAPLRAAWGWGLASIHASGQVLDTYFPSPRLGLVDNSAAPEALISAVIDDEAREVRTELVMVEIDLDAPPATTSDAYLRLHLLSHRLVRPRGLNLDGIFGSLPNVVWTSAGPCAIEGFERVRTRLRARGGHLTIFGVDKFPRMVDYVVPPGVRIGDADRVRLGPRRGDDRDA
jgi:2,3,4,5-tetrahydropyridine-2,6-dicarboxylate N-succinyltransferase